MRLRFNKNAKNILLKSPNFICDDLNKIDPHKFFQNNNPIYLEIGSGKGDFIINNANLYKDINFIALEKNETILAKAVRKAESLKLTNLVFLNLDAEKINEYFLDHTINKLYLNFSDPWPKKRHTKRRLTNPIYLNRYKLLLKNLSSNIEFKTDNDGLFEYTYNDVLTLNQDKYNIIYYTKDLYNNLNEFNNSLNIATEYEKKFHSLGKNIYKIVFSYKK